MSTPALFVSERQAQLHASSFSFLFFSFLFFSFSCHFSFPTSTSALPARGQITDSSIGDQLIVCATKF
jgi:hypothetical protein